MTHAVNIDLHDFMTPSDLFNFCPERLNTHVHQLRNGYAIPIEACQEYLKSTLAVYGEDSYHYIIFLTMVLTGCRPCEIDNFKVDTATPHGTISWKLGKNQRKMRSHAMPVYWWQALRKHRQAHKILNSACFSVSSLTFRRIFNRDIRPLLSDAWSQKVSMPREELFSSAYDYQTKGLRKTFATWHFYHYWKTLSDAEVAGMKVCKHLCHSTEHMTKDHYIEDGKRIGVEKYLSHEYHDLFAPDIQQKLT